MEVSLNTHAPTESPGSVPKPAGVAGILGCFENWIVTTALILIAALPILEVLLRLFDIGISGSSSIVQHLTLLVGMLGGAIAARENRLLALSPASTFLKGTPKLLASIFSHAIGAAVTVFLAVASYQYVVAIKPLRQIFVYGIPVWTVILILAVGFSIIAIRLIWHAADQWSGRTAALLLAAASIAFVHWVPINPENLVIPALLVLGIATLLGAPVFTLLGGLAMILFWGAGEPVSVVPLKHYTLNTNATLPSIPLFTLAGYFLAESQSSRRLVEVFQKLTGHVRGGPAIATALVCAFFTSFTGASGVTILALGGLLMPVLLSAKYSERNALGLLTGAGSLGLLFPPCLPLILYTIVSNTSAQTDIRIEQMFLGGIGPGLLMLVLTAVWGVRQASWSDTQRPPFDWREAGRAVWNAKWELLIPVVALVSLFSGYATTLQASAITALYALLVVTVIHRDLKWFSDLPRVITDCGMLVGGVLLILGVALGFTAYLIDAQIPEKAVEWVTAAIQSKYLFLLALNVFLLIVGCLMDIYSAIIVVAPLLVPLGMAFGIDPIHLGIIFLANMELGYLTPPVGMNLFLASYRFNKPMSEVIRAAFPMLLVLLFGVLVITYIPALTTFLPALIR